MLIKDKLENWSSFGYIIKYIFEIVSSIQKAAVS